ncbi:MAG: carboxypeptidase, partial [Bacteroidota bacterium]|nr:carboxypeptidase [Bacteroidota bacterium]
YSVGYEASGSADDWLYSTTRSSGRVISFTAEVGTPIDYKEANSFWPPIDSSLRHARENYPMCRQLALSAGANIQTRSVASDFDSSKGLVNLKVTVANIGIQKSESDSKLHIIPVDTSVHLIDTDREIPSLETSDTISFTFEILQPKNFFNGKFVPFDVSIEHDGYFIRDTFDIQLFKPEIIPLLIENTDSVKWSSERWGFEKDNKNGDIILSDSPYSQYKDSSNNYVYYYSAINLSGYKSATLEFDTRWITEKGYDYGSVEVSIDDGKTWFNLKSAQMREGYDLKGILFNHNIWGFSGASYDWKRIICPLDMYLDETIKFRFGFHSDENKHFEGWMLKNISVNLFKEIDNGIGYHNGYDYSFSRFPNPIHIGQILRIEFDSFELPFSSSCTLNLIDLLGRVSFTERRNNLLNQKLIYEIPIEGMSPGAYIIELIYGSKTIIDKVIILD